LTQDDTRNVAPRLRQARDIASGNRVEVHCNDHDRDSGGRLLGSLQHRLRSRSHDDVHIQAYELGREGRKSSHIALGALEFDDEILALDVSEFAQTLDHSFGEGGGARIDRGKDTDLDCPSRRLRLRGE